MEPIASSSSNTQFMSRASYHPKKTIGTFRVVTDDFAHFSLDEDFEDDSDISQVINENDHNSGPKPTSNQPLITNNHYGDKEKRKESSRIALENGPKELSRLTDEIEIDGDSASDELDLLPPLPPSRKGSKWKFPDWMCCRSRVPPKCNIM